MSRRNGGLFKVLGGIGIGVGIGMLLAPKSGEELRKDLAKKISELLDKAKEIVLGKSKIGTTGKGIGPCYSDKAARLGLRIGNLIDKEYLKKRLEEVLPIKNIELKAFGIEDGVLVNLN